MGNVFTPDCNFWPSEVPSPTASQCIGTSTSGPLSQSVHTPSATQVYLRLTSGCNASHDHVALGIFAVMMYLIGYKI